MTKPAGRGLILVAPDKFRGTLTASEAAAAIQAGVHAVSGECRILPMGDGGEGTLDCFHGTRHSAHVSGPLGNVVAAEWLLCDSGVAVIESARACGMQLAGGAEGNDPVAASTRGVGELIIAALDRGASRVLVGAGGSASTDGGQGAVEAIDESGWLPRIAGRVYVGCDVTTAFTDAGRVFAAQKGATDDQIGKLTLRLHHLRALYRDRYGLDVDALPGSGAAGGLAGGLAAIGARLASGFNVLSEELGLTTALRGVDLVITGEGRFDATSLDGKVVGGILAQAQARGIPVLAIVGSSDGTTAPGLTVVSPTDLVGRQRAYEDAEQAVREAVIGCLSDACHGRMPIPGESDGDAR
jgi:glycerate kinase